MGNFKFKFESIIGVKEIQEKRLQEAISAIDIEIEGLRYQLFVVIEERNIVNARMIDHAMKVAEYQSAKIYDSMLDNKAVSIEKMIIGLQRKKEIKKNELALVAADIHPALYHDLLADVARQIPNIRSFVHMNMLILIQC